MPCDDDEVDMNAPDAEPPCTPPKPTGNGGAVRVDPDGQMNSDSEDSDEPCMDLVPCQVQIVHGKQSEMDQDDIARESNLHVNGCMCRS